MGGTEHWKRRQGMRRSMGTLEEHLEQYWEDHYLEHHWEEGEHKRRREAWEEHKEDGEHCMGEPRLVVNLAGSGQDIAVGPSRDKRQQAGPGVGHR